MMWTTNDNDWDPGLTKYVNSTTQSQALGALREMSFQVERLALMNQALWELLREKLHMSDEELEQKAHEVDMRDGVADSKMTATPVRCPSCSRVCNARHAKCLYCGQRFQKPIFG